MFERFGVNPAIATSKQRDLPPQARNNSSGSARERPAPIPRLAADRIQAHLQRRDFSRWLADVFRHHPLAAHVRELERRAVTEDARDLAADIAQ